MDDFERIKRFVTERPGLPLGDADKFWLVLEVEKLRKENAHLKEDVGYRETRIRTLADTNADLKKKLSDRGMG